MSPQERALWLHLRELRIGFHFRHQVLIKDFIVDFACYHPRVVVELDGSQHAKERHALRDGLRDAQLAADGFKIIRVWNNDIESNLDGVFDHILHALNDLAAPHPTDCVGRPPHKGEV